MQALAIEEDVVGEKPAGGQTEELDAPALLGAVAAVERLGEREPQKRDGETEEEREMVGIEGIEAEIDLAEEAQQIAAFEQQESRRQTRHQDPAEARAGAGSSPGRVRARR